MSRNTDFIPFARPAIGTEEERAVISVLRSGWLTTGREAKKFEEEFAEYVGAGYTLAVSSATAGLHLSLEALGCINEGVNGRPLTQLKNPRKLYSSPGSAPLTTISPLETAS